MKLLHALLLSALIGSASAHAAGAQDCQRALEAGNNAEAAAQARQSLQKSATDREAQLCLAQAEDAQAHFPEAITALQSALKLSQQPQDRMIALTLLGNVQREAKQPEQAAVSYQASLDLARVEKNSALVRINTNQLGETQQDLGHAAQALDYYQQGLVLAANDNERADSHARVAAAYSLLGKHDEAIAQQVKSVLYEEKAGDFNHYANANIELGRICLAGKQYADAEKWLGKFLGTIAEAGDSYWQAKARGVLAQVKAASGDRDEAARQFAQAKAMAEKIGAVELLKELQAAEATSK